jgi:hypothetical protein
LDSIIGKLTFLGDPRTVQPIKLVIDDINVLCAEYFVATSVVDLFLQRSAVMFQSADNTFPSSEMDLSMTALLKKLAVTTDPI